MIKPATGFINQPCLIPFSKFFGGNTRIKLSPALIKGRPKYNGGVVVQFFHHFLQVLIILLSSRLILPCKEFIMNVPDFSGTLIPNIRKIRHKEMIVGPASARHILPYKNPLSVTMIIKTIRLDLHVFPNGIEAKGLGLTDVVK